MILTQDSIDKHLSSLSVRGHSDTTVSAYRKDLTGWLIWLSGYSLKIGMMPDTWEELEQAGAAYLTEHRKTWKPRTVQRRMAAMRSWAKYHHHPAFLADYRAPTPAPATPHPIAEGPDGVRRMIMRIKAGAAHHRALVVLCGMCALRVDEAVNVRPDDFTGPDGDRWLLVRGKGDKERQVPVSGEAWKFLERAVDNARRDGTTVVRLTQGGARYAIRRHARNAGLSRPVASHDLRATAATAAYRRTRNLRAVQGLLGHASTRTTEVYTGVSADELRATVEEIA